MKHLDSLKVCSINFRDFTLDGDASASAGRKPTQSSSAGGNTNYDKRRRSREAKEQRKKQKRKAQLGKSRDKIAQRIAKAKRYSRRGH